MSGVHLGVLTEGAYFLRPDNQEEKNLLEEFIEKIKSLNPEEWENCEMSD